MAWNTRCVVLIIIIFSIQASSLHALQSIPKHKRPKHSPTANDYCGYWDALLLAEYEHFSTTLRDQQKSWSRRRLEDNGISIFGAIAEPDTEVLGEKIVRIFKAAAVGEKETKFRDHFARGDILLFTPTISTAANHKQVDSISRECMVIDVGQNWMTVGVGPTWPQGLWESRKDKTGKFYQVRLDRAAPQAPLKAQRQSLQRLRLGRAGQAAAFLERSFVHPNLAVQRAARPSSNQTWFDDEKRNGIHRALDDACRLSPFTPNPSQKAAIVWALQRSISLIRGPPGTGKTRVAAMLIATALKLDNYQRQLSTPQQQQQQKHKTRVLAVAHSNGASDVLLEALLQMGVPAVRLGRPASVSPILQHRTVVAMAQKMPDIIALRRSLGDPTLDDQGRSYAAYKLRHETMEAQEMILEAAPVVVTSCIGAHQLFSTRDDEEDMHGSLEKKNEEDEAPKSSSSSSLFSLVVLDEASQTTEPALLCALAAARAEQLVLVGDTKQLPPTVLCMELQKTLGVSPMARLEQAHMDVYTLQTQYRMCSSLLEHPSKYFYNGMVKSSNKSARLSSSSSSSFLPTGFPWPSQEPLAFVQIGTGDSERHHRGGDNSGGRSNPTEAQVTARIVSRLLRGGDLDPKQVAIITPYAKQVQQIRFELTELQRRRLLRQGRDVRFARSMTVRTGDGVDTVSFWKEDQVRVGTVDSFQGQETEIVILSTVRSNPTKELGFLKDPRRLNVAITRARRGLIILGDASTLQTCRHWQALLASCRDRNCTMDEADYFSFCNDNEEPNDVVSNHCNTTITTTTTTTTNSSMAQGLDDISSEIYQLFNETDDDFYGLF